MTTECNAHEFDFQGLGTERSPSIRRGAITSTPADYCCGGGSQDRHSAAICGVFHRPSRSRAGRNTVPELMAQRIFALALGYEDLNTMTPSP